MGGTQGQAKANGLLEGTPVPERKIFICSDGTVLPATLSPVLAKWFADEPAKAAAAKIWRCYPRTLRDGLAVFVIGAESAPTEADAQRLRREVDRFEIAGVCVNCTTGKSNKGSRIVVRINRNELRPQGVSAKSPNWRPRLLFLKGGLRPTAKYKGKFVRLLCRRQGTDLNVLALKESAERTPTPIDFVQPQMQWPWPFAGRTAEVAQWCKDWWDRERDVFRQGHFHRVPLLVGAGLLSSQHFKPPFVLAADGDQVADAMFRRLDRFQEVHQLLTQRFLLPAIEGKATAQIQTEAERVRLVIRRLRRMFSTMDTATKEQFLENTGLHLMLREQLICFEHAVFRIGKTKAGELAVNYEGIPASACVDLGPLRLRITGKLSNLLLDKLSGWHNEEEITSSRSSKQEPPPKKDYGMATELLNIGQMFIDGHRDAVICNKYGILPGQLKQLASVLVSNEEWVADNGLDRSEESDYQEITSAVLRQVLRYRLREAKGLTKRGRAPKATKPAV